MHQVHEMVFDGEVLRPVERLELEPNTRYRVMILPNKTEPERPRTLTDFFDEFGGTIEGPGDWSVELDHYLYGTPKRGNDPT
jgi:hypothetical protein